MKKILVIGASGLVGSHIVSQLGDQHDVIAASRTSDAYPVDISDEESVKALFQKTGLVDAIICTAGMANFAPWDQATTADWSFAISNKMMGQINIVRHGCAHVTEGGAIVLTTGVLARHPIPGSAMVSAVNAAVEAVIAAVKIELDGSVRIGAISPGWVTETMTAMGMDPTPGIPAADVAAHFVRFIESGQHGDIIIASKNP